MENSTPDEVKNENTILDKLTSIDEKLGSLLGTQVKDDFNAIRADKLYSQKCYDGVFLPDETKKELCDSFIKMEAARTANDILTYALYTYKQSESILNHFIKITGTDTIYNDLTERSNNNSLLIHVVFSGYKNTNINIDKNLDKKVIDNYEQYNIMPDVSELTYMNRVRYFMWYFDNKLSTKGARKESRKNDFFFLSDNPYYYLSTARSRIHGGFKRDPTEAERTRLSEITESTAKFLMVFNTLLYGFHKRFFSYNNL